MPLYQVDAFTDKVFGGNPAAVCLLSEWLEEDLMQKIAMENNLAETAFLVKEGDQFHIRWFTPAVEVDLCGHATLAAAFVLFEQEKIESDRIDFFSPRSGSLFVNKNNDLLALNFPKDELHELRLEEIHFDLFNQRPEALFQGKTDLMFVFDNEKDIDQLIPSFEKIAQLDCRGIIVTAAGNKVDFVSRFFAPQSGINEDPVTGSAHTTLTPYWTERLEKSELTAMQLSKRKGILHCRLINDRVQISGKAQLYLKGSIYI
ncbi:MAG: PhzF family phenazine biosynthesis protein [Bacteroidota bacterium]